MKKNLATLVKTAFLKAGAPHNRKMELVLQWNINSVVPLETLKRTEFLRPCLFSLMPFRVNRLGEFLPIV
jgi:hypothetical protein